MIPTTLISAGRKNQLNVIRNGSPTYLYVSEFFANTIQGEGDIGYPATFLRLAGCTLNCTFCDTKEVWQTGSAWTFNQLFALLEEYYIIDKLRCGQRLILTGGSPLKQQLALVNFIQEFIRQYKFKPYIEIENECMIMPERIIPYINKWNNSPKLSNSGRFKTHDMSIIKTLVALPNSTFKFVIANESDVIEIMDRYVNTEIIPYEKIIVMPMGATMQELAENRMFVVQVAIDYGFRYTTREHVVLWGERTGV